MTQITRCPNCSTPFRVTPAQLAAYQGKVRCGRCAFVFHAPDFFEKETPAPAQPAPAQSVPAQAAPATPATPARAIVTSSATPAAPKPAAPTATLVRDANPAAPSVPAKTFLTPTAAPLPSAPRPEPIPDPEPRVYIPVAARREAAQAQPATSAPVAPLTPTAPASPTFVAPKHSEAEEDWLVQLLEAAANFNPIPMSKSAPATSAEKTELEQKLRLELAQQEQQEQPESSQDEQPAEPEHKLDLEFEPEGDFLNEEFSAKPTPQVSTPPMQLEPEEPVEDDWLPEEWLEETPPQPAPAEEPIAARPIRPPFASAPISASVAAPATDQEDTPAQDEEPALAEPPAASESTEKTDWTMFWEPAPPAAADGLQDAEDTLPEPVESLLAEGEDSAREGQVALADTEPLAPLPATPVEEAPAPETTADTESQDSHTLDPRVQEEEAKTEAEMDELMAAIAEANAAEAEAERLAAASLAPEPSPAAEAASYRPIVLDDDMFLQLPAAPTPPASRWWWLVSLIALLSLGLQLVYFNRAQITMALPGLRPQFVTACSYLHCTMPLPKQVENLRTEWHELTFVPGYTNLVQLSATLRNLAPYEQALPQLQLTLVNERHEVLARRIFRPEEYLVSTEKGRHSLVPNDELHAFLQLDLGTLNSSDYEIYWLYN